MRLHCSLRVCAAALTFFALALVPAYGQAPGGAESQYNVFQNIKFRSVGPAIAGGRVTSVVGIPGNPNIYYIGAAGGGVWKSTDGGNHWTAIFDNEPTSSISDVVLDPHNPGIVWVATGEVNIRNDVLDGAGLYRSNDAGKTWQLMGFKDAGNISRVMVDPHNSNNVWVAVLGHVWGPNAERGVFKSTNGGKTWKKVLFINDHTGAIDLTTDGANSQVLFAAMWQAQRYPWMLDEGGADSGLYRSTDGGDTWVKLSDGIPKTPLGRIAVAVAPSNPERVYALIETRRGHGLLFDSNDAGAHWQKVSDNYALDGRPFYYTHVYVAPRDENELYFDSLLLMESEDGGRSVHPLDPGMHVDNHAFWQDPDDPARMIQGNDGGVYLSLDGGATWRFGGGTYANVAGGGGWNFTGTLPIEQFYQVAVDSRRPYDVCGGLQDNGGWCGPATAGQGLTSHGHRWFTVVGGDGQYVVPAPSDPDIIYGDSQNGAIVRYDLKSGVRVGIKPYHALGSLELKDQKYRFNWTAPIAVSPTDAHTVFLGANVVFKSTDGGTHWSIISPDLTRNDKSKEGLTGGPVNHDLSGAENYDTLLSLELAPTDQKVIWAGSDDGLVHVTQDGGGLWNNVTPPGAPRWGRAFKIGVSPFNAGTAYVAYDNHEMNDLKPYVYATDNYGKSWRSIAKGLPDEPVLVVREDPNQKGFLVLGNMTGLWFSRDDGAHWEKFQSGFPTAAVFDLKFVEHDLVVATHGRGLFVLHNLRPFEEMNDAVAKQALHLFTPSIGTEYSFTAGHASRLVLIDYYLKDSQAANSAGRGPHRTPVNIVISDASGQVVATGYGPARAGVNEYRWTMRYPGPVSLDFVHPHGLYVESSTPGPEVLPGTYRVAVTVAGETREATVTVRGDPNLSISTSVQRANLKFALEARNHLSAFNGMLNRITTMQKTLTDFTGSAAANGAQYASIAARARALDMKLTALKNSIYNPLIQRNVGEDIWHYLPRLNRDVHSIGGGFGGNPAEPPTAQELANAQVVWTELGEKLVEFNSMLAGEVASYNKAAFAAGAPTVLAGAPVEVKPVQM